MSPRAGSRTVRDPASGEEWIMGPGGSVSRPCPPDCVDGYRPVSHLYAIGIADPETDPGTYAAAMNSVYPCGTCNPEVARLWSAGHFTLEHASGGGCEDCKPKPTGRFSRR